MTPPHPSSALPPQALREAVPKGISGRASYLQVCLVFRSEPRVIAALFNGLAFGPPRGLTPASACPRLDHLGFGSAARDCTPHSGSLSLRLRDCNPLASPRAATRRLILQKARRHPPRGGPRHLVGPRFQVLFHSPRRGSFHLSLTVLVRCRWPLRYLALDRGRPGFGQGSSCPALLRNRAMETGPLRVRGSHALRRAFPCPSAAPRFSHNSTGNPRAALQPRPKAVWAPPSSLAATGGISVDFLSRATQMVHFARSGPAALFHSRARRAPLGARVAPFGDPGIVGRSPLPPAYRSLPRPSSPGGPSGIRRGPIIAWPYPPSRAPTRGRGRGTPLASSPLPSLPPVKDPRGGRAAAPEKTIWRIGGSNPGPPACKAGALAS